MSKLGLDNEHYTYNTHDILYLFTPIITTSAKVGRHKSATNVSSGRELRPYVRRPFKHESYRMRQSFIDYYSCI
jgi:hypothetical protein